MRALLLPPTFVRSLESQSCAVRPTILIRTSRAKHAVHFGLFLGSDQRERHQKTHRITMQGDLRG